MAVTLVYLTNPKVHEYLVRGFGDFDQHARACQRDPQRLHGTPADNLVEVFLHDMIVKPIGGRTRCGKRPLGCGVGVILDRFRSINRPSRL